MKPRTVVIAHRAAMFAEGLAAALSGFPQLIPVATLTSAGEAEWSGIEADAAAVDADMPGAAALVTRLRGKGVRVAMIGESDGDAEDLRVSPHSAVAALAAALVPGGLFNAPARNRLTAREREILSLGAKGLAAKQVARHLGISPKTVEQHKTRIFAKLGVRNQTAAVSVAFRRHAIAIEEHDWTQREVRDFPSYRVSPNAATV